MLQLIHPQYSSIFHILVAPRVLKTGRKLSASHLGHLAHLGSFQAGTDRGYMTRGDTNKPETFEAVKQGCEEMLQLLKVRLQLENAGNEELNIVEHS